MAAKVLQQRGGPLWARQACCGTVRCHQVPPVSQLGVILFPTLLAMKELPVGRVALLKLALQMVLLVKHGLAKLTVLVLFVHRLQAAA